MDAKTHSTKAALFLDAFENGDAVATIGVLLGTAMDREQDLDRLRSKARSNKDGVGETYFEAARRHEYERSLILRDMLSAFPAVTLDGATIQVAQALIEFDLLIDDLPEEIETYEMRRRGAAITRLLHSVLAVLEKQTNRKASELVTENFRFTYSNIWENAEDRVAAVKVSLGA